MIMKEHFPFTVMDSQLGTASSLPQLPLTLIYQENSLTASGLLDTGATVNVLPYSIGVKLGAVWEWLTTPVRLSGNLARSEARVLIVSARVGKFAPVRLAFAWTRSDETPLILGQVNFFMEFDVCFYRSRSFFEVRAKEVLL